MGAQYFKNAAKYQRQVLRPELIDKPNGTVVGRQLLPSESGIAETGINKLKTPPPAPAAVDAPPPRQEVLLEQIRDALVKR
jgi:hypothetical protein